MERVNAGQVDAAISRLPLQSNASVEQVLANALRLKLTVLVEACREELRSRGSLILTAADVGQIAKIEARVLNMTLRDVIEIAFREVPPKEEEVLILRWIASHPGTSYTELLKVYGRNDLSLVIGHLVYHRFGYFPIFPEKQHSVRPPSGASEQADRRLLYTSPGGCRWPLRLRRNRLLPSTC